MNTFADSTQNNHIPEKKIQIILMLNHTSHLKDCHDLP